MGRRDAATFVHDSVLSGFDTLLAFLNTDVHQLFGDEDLTAAVPETYQWSQSVSTKKVTECVANSGHSMESEGRDRMNRPREPLVEVRYVRIQHGDFLLEHVIN